MRPAARRSERPTVPARASVIEWYLEHERATIRPPPPGVQIPMDLRAIAASIAPEAMPHGINARSLEERLQAGIDDAVRRGTSMALVLCDLDRLRQINDRYGILAGDAVLKFVAALVQGRLRAEDTLVRCGEDELAILMRGVDLTRAGRAAERFRSAVGGGAALFDGQLIPASISAGCASLACCGEPTAGALLGIAKQRLALAKLRGRNRVVVA